MRKRRSRPEFQESAAVIDNNELEVESCSQAELDDHLRAFISTFVLPQAQPRWQEFLISKRANWSDIPRSPRNAEIVRKAAAVLRTFPNYQRHCVLVGGSDRSEDHYGATFRTSSGVYFELGTPPCRITALEAETRFSTEGSSALLSFEPGKKALFFCHDGGIWKCEKS